MKRSHRSARNKNAEPDFHRLDVAAIVDVFGTSARLGMDDTRASRRRLQRGENAITHTRPRLKLISYFFNGLCALLWVASILSFVNYYYFSFSPPDASLLIYGSLSMGVIFFSSLILIYQDINTVWILNKMRHKRSSETADNMADVIRNGEAKRVPVEEFVVGDLVCLSNGQRVPADVRLIESRDFKLDTSTLTGECGESDSYVQPAPPGASYAKAKNMALMSTRVTNGEAKGIVVLKGDQTWLGRMAELARQTSDKPIILDIELNRFATTIIVFSIITTVSVLVWMFTYDRIYAPAEFTANDLMANALSSITSFIPSSMPLVVALALLIVGKRMERANVLVKNHAAVETFSSLGVLACDKTGTLTTNRMSVVELAVGADPAHANLVEMRKRRHLTSAASSLGLRRLLHACALCSNAHDEGAGVVGDAIDVALLHLAGEFEDVHALAGLYTTTPDGGVPFDSANKWMMKIIRRRRPRQADSTSASGDVLCTDGDDDEDGLMLIKGASDVLINKVSHIAEANGSLRALDADDLERIERLHNAWCVLGRRVLVVCSKRLLAAGSERTSAEWKSVVDESSDLCLLGMVAISDEPRQGMAGQIAKIKAAGVRVLMMSGDHALTATALAIQVGILTTANFHTLETMTAQQEDDSTTTTSKARAGSAARRRREQAAVKSLLLTGADIGQLDENDWSGLVSSYDEIVFARVSPEQKLTIVKEFQKAECIVGVVGDGGNDAPAMKCANISIAMASGNDVAIQVAQVVLLDDRFESILTLLKNGRLTFANIRKVILYLIPGGCMAELVSTMLYIFVGVPQNLSAFSMIVITFGTDVLPALSLMLEKEEDDMMLQAPRSHKDSLVDFTVFFQGYAFIGMLIAFASQLLFFLYFQLNYGFSFALMAHTSNPRDLYTKVDNSSSISTEDAVLEAFYTGTSITFTCIVILQIIGNLMTTRTHRRSFFQQLPFQVKTRNGWPFLAGLFSLAVCLIVNNAPAIQSKFDSRSIPIVFYIVPVFFGLVLFSLDELRKLAVRRKMLYMEKWAW